MGNFNISIKNIYTKSSCVSPKALLNVKKIKKKVNARKRAILKKKDYIVFKIIALLGTL